MDHSLLRDNVFGSIQDQTNHSIAALISILPHVPRDGSHDLVSTCRQLVLLLVQALAHAASAFSFQPSLSDWYDIDGRWMHNPRVQLLCVL